MYNYEVPFPPCPPCPPSDDDDDPDRPSDADSDAPRECKPKPPRVRRRKTNTCKFDLNTYENEEYLKNPLLRFRLERVHQRRHFDTLQSHAVVDKIRTARAGLRPELNCHSDLVPTSQRVYTGELRAYTAQTPIPPMLKRIERQMLGFVPLRLRKKYPNIVAAYMTEVHSDYLRILRAFALQRILRPAPGDYVPPREPFRFQQLGRTARYDRYLRNRRRLKRSLHMFLPFVRAIVAFSIADFGPSMNDYGAYRFNAKGQPLTFTLKEFAIRAKADLDAGVMFVAKEWYPKVVRTIRKAYRKHTVPKAQWPGIFTCIKGLINRQLTLWKIATHEHISNVLLDRLRIPVLRLEVVCTGSTLDLSPSFQEWFQMWRAQYDFIARVGNRLPALELQVDDKWKGSEDLTLVVNFVQVGISAEYMQFAHKALRATLTRVYAEVLEYLDAFRKEYMGLIGPKRRSQVYDFLNDDHEYDEYFELIEEFLEYDRLLQLRPVELLFPQAVVNETIAIRMMREMVRSYVEDVSSSLVVRHQAESRAISDCFRAIEVRAMEIPLSTEMLLANGEYMLQVKIGDIHVLRERIQENLRVAGKLLELTEMSAKHTALQIEMIALFNNMQGVFDRNASLFEAYKAQFEEHLQAVKTKLVGDIESLVPMVRVINDMTETEKFRDYAHQLSTFTAQLQCFADHIEWVNKEEKLFKLGLSKYPLLEELENFVNPFGELIRYCIRWLRHYNVWMYGPFDRLVPVYIEEQIGKYQAEFMRMKKAYYNRIKQDMIGAPACKFRGQSEDPNPEGRPAPMRLTERMIQSIKDFKTGAFIIQIMCNPALRTRHWLEISAVAGFDLTPDAGTTLSKIIDMGLDDKLDAFEIISVGANKELQLQNNLAQMIKEWESVLFPISNYKETDIKILSGLDDIQALLDDHLIKTLTMRGSAFVKPCEDEVKEWYEKLVRVNHTLEEWGKVQSNWLYLLPIFSSKDIVSQMPEEGKLFVNVDQTFRRNMMMVQREPLVMVTGPAPGVMESMEGANVNLEDIVTGVNNYLEKKRLYFPRFFFLSNDEMLEILSETKDPLRVQPHLSKCFEGIYRLEFDPNLIILGMLSIDREHIKFVNTISAPDAKGSVEKWLLRTEEEMLLSVQNECAKCFDDHMETPRLQWLLSWPQMVILCMSQVFWAVEVHRCLGERSLELVAEFAVKLKSDMLDIVAMMMDNTMTNLNRIAIKSLIVIDVHAKDLIDEVVKMKVDSVDDFLWLSQLRYYWEEGIALVRIINATVPFGNEYLGNSDRLVITPLTDRCYRTLVGAYQLHVNGAPEGPAGTGKTETTKDLAKALAVQCKVFNCSDGLDYKAMGKFFKGLASSGAWACFDEFNRIELEVLSVIAQQILCIIVAVRKGLVSFMFEGTLLLLKPTCYVCITMNPGYAGRAELPDNLKVLFRTVAMMVPDYAMIGEISLYSYGFENARKLAVKIVTTYRLSSEQLSSQNHYDFGMRAVKTVLSACGNLKQTFPKENEDILLLRSLIDVNLPKFLSFDVPLFEGIISDIFPGVKLMDPDNSLMHKQFTAVCEEWNLQPTDSFFVKVIQTFEMMIVRHGFMMVGIPFAGKSVTLRTLGAMLKRMEEFGLSRYHRDTELRIVNPKSITMGQLYGAFDPISYEWTDGIGATIYRNFVTDTSENRKWLIFDGPIDAVWIENMNTVLDDNKKLCLTSGEVITMTFQMSIIFEVMDLAQASPATVSRCGMIYMEPITLGWQTFATSWINQCNPAWAVEYREFIMELFVWVVPAMTTFVVRNATMLLSPGEFNLLHTTMSIFEMLLNDAVEESPEDYEKYLITWFQAALIYAVVWGIGGLLNAASRDKFDVVHRAIWEGVSEATPAPGLLKGKIDVSIPMENNLSEYVYIFKQKGAWKHWPDLVRRIDPDVTALGIQVHTIDTGRYMHLLDLHIKHKRKLLFVGPTGTGKSYYTQNTLMNKLSPNDYLPAFITLTVMITANQCQALVISKLEKRKRGIYGPPKGKLAVFFVDDMNMPVKDNYGSQPPLELLRQHFDYGHFYDLKDTSQLWVKDILVMSACGLPGGSRQNVYARFLSHFNTFSINEFNTDTMQRIFVNVLMIYMKRNGHGTDVYLPVQSFVLATLQLYYKACSALRPTPVKSHYVFNLRDVARLCGGFSMLRKESVDNKRCYAKIWCHEAMRVFYDRLIEDGDRNQFFEWMCDCVRDQFRDRMEGVFETYVDAESPVVTLATVRRLMFGTFMDLNLEPVDRRYEEIPSVAKFFDIATLALEDYNSTHKSRVDIVLFAYALEHLNRICRIISMPAGSALLVGIGGSGRQSLTKLAANICWQSVFQVEITKNYDINSWREDLKKVLKESGGRNKDVVFLFTEAQIKEEAFLMDVDCLLNLGEVPNIWPIDEKQEVLEMVRLDAQGGNRNIDVSALQVFSFFVTRCKMKLHMLLCFSPIGASFRNRIRMFPSLVNCCTIDWYDAWPSESLEMVANMYMDSVDIPDEVKLSVSVSCQRFHVTALHLSKRFAEDTGRITYITSASFLALVQTFQTLMKRKQKEIMDLKMRYVGGLDTLASAAVAVAVMQKELEDLEPQLVIAEAQSNVISADIAKKQKDAEITKDQVTRDTIVANEKMAIVEVFEAECTKDLALATPMVEEALAALNTLKPADITLVKSMKNPPSVVKLVMAAVCIMKGFAPEKVNDAATGRKVLDYWGPSKRMMGDMSFLQSLKEYDKENIPLEVMRQIRKDYIPNPDFKPHIVAKASSAAEGLCKWIIAMDSFDLVNKEVAPKKAKLKEAKEDMQNTKDYLAEKTAMADELDRKLAILNEDRAIADANKQALADKKQDCKDKKLRAEQLIGSLGGEKVRWTAAANALQGVYDKLAGDVLISCGFIAYLSPVTAGYRIEAVSDWHQFCKGLKIPCSETYALTEVLGTEIQIQSWQLAGLPRDTFSSENAIVMANSTRCSLFIDPQEQANKWIKKYERNNRLQVLKFSMTTYMSVLEHCMEMGYPALIENVLEDVEAPLDCILMKSTFVQNNILYISMGENAIPLSPKFKLYLTSNLRNPHYLPETFNKVTIVNFALTPEGLEDQLLGIAVAKERPDLQELREKLIEESAYQKALLNTTEINILTTLSSAGNKILEDESAVRILDDSKVLSMEIKEKQEAGKVTEVKIEAFRLSYRPLAVHSSILYYCITDMEHIDPMYQFSLNWYITLYMMSIETANKSKELVKRLKYLIDTITHNLYTNVCRSIFEKDKLLFSFILTTKIQLASNQISNDTFQQLLVGSTKEAPQHKNPADTWITEKMWKMIYNLQEVPSLKEFPSSFTQQLDKWKHFFDITNPELEELAAPWQSKVSAFEKLLVLQAFRPDKLAAAIHLYVQKEMGVSYVTPPQFDIAKSFIDSNFLTPLVFILSPGADPMGTLMLLCDKMGQTENFRSISLGQGQGPIAKKLIEEAQVAGSWVCLQNCHVAASWMPKLVEIWEKFDIQNTNANFRMWLTSYPSPIFPTSFLRNGVKMTNEPPTGLQQNMLRSYLSEPINDPMYYEGCPGKDKAFSRMLYGLCFFHAVVQERKQFGALGWNIPYEFNDSDMHISVQQLQLLINQYESIPFTAICYLTGECNYGGRVTDIWDRRLIVCLLENYINDNAVQDMSYRYADEQSYALPLKIEHRDVVTYIRDIVPPVTMSNVYGLHSNAGITRDLNRSNLLLDTMVQTQGGGGGGAKSGGGDSLAGVLQEIVAKLPKNFDILENEEKYPTDYNESMNTVLVQEMKRFNNLLSIIRRTSVELLQSMEGIIVQTKELELIAVALAVRKLPPGWMKYSYPSLKPVGSYIQDLVDRLAFLQLWSDVGKPKTFWLPAFFFTQAFLTAAMQNFARKYAIPIDTLCFDNTVLPVFELDKAAVDGVYVGGLYIEGCRWNLKTAMLDDQLPKVLITKVPLIHLLPCLMVALQKGTRYTCPMYKTAERRGILSTTGHSSNYVIFLLLPTDKPSAFWIKRSAAMICQTND